jgi:hemolysin activation/secretion protein
MMTLKKLIKFYVFATCTGFSYLSLHSPTKAQTLPHEVESEPPISVNHQNQENQENPKASSSAELIRKLKGQRISQTQNRSDLIERLKRRNTEPQRNQILTSTSTSTSTTVESLPPESIAVSNTGVKIQNVEVLGSTVFSKPEIEEAVKPFIGQQARFEQLLAIRTAVTDMYTKRGYTTSGAFLPPQDVSKGVVNIQVVEGELERIEVKGLHRLRSSYVRQRVERSAGKPINLSRLETALQMLQVDPLFTSVQAELKSGTIPGRSVLSLTLKEARPITSSFTIENRDSPSVGSIRGSSNFGYQNLLGFGDKLTAQVGYTSGANSFDVGYSIPLNASDGTLSLRYANSDSRIIEEPFSPLDILGKTSTFSLGYRQPIVNTPKQEFTLGFSADLRDSQTYLLRDIPFSFSTGPEDGKSRVAVLRFSQDWIDRTPQRVLAARSQFSLGVGAFGATVNNTGVDGRFLSWVGQFQWAQNLGQDVISIARIGTQLTPDSLLPLEQFSIGGVDTLRGFRQNQFVADNGITGSVEVRFPLVKNSSWGSLQVAPFVDFGKVWNNNGIGVDNSLFASTGLSLRWQISNFAVRLDWGFPLNSIRKQGDSLQDNGLFFSLMYQPF